jgi:hypothetical protein
LAYVYFEEESERRNAAKLLTKDEARRIAVNFAGAIAPVAVIGPGIAPRGSEARCLESELNRKL